MTIKKIMFDKTVDLFKDGIKFLFKNKNEMILTNLHDKFIPIVPIETSFGIINFYCCGAIPLWRAKSLLTKEPETIEWMDSFEKGATFWDIGANVGLYSIYAALKSKAEVLAFEPSGFNYFVLNKNIELNKLDNKIQALSIAFNDKTALDYLHLSSTTIGDSQNSFALEQNWEGKPFKPEFNQGAIAFSIDEFIKKFTPRFPTYIKIDVDGIENKIIGGAKNTIKDKRLKSMLVELDTKRTEYCQNVEAELKEAGMTLVEKKHSAMFDDGPAASVYNHIFSRF